MTWLTNECLVLAHKPRFALGVAAGAFGAILTLRPGFGKISSR